MQFLKANLIPSMDGLTHFQLVLRWLRHLHTTKKMCLRQKCQRTSLASFFWIDVGGQSVAANQEAEWNKQSGIRKQVKEQGRCNFLHRVLINLKLSLYVSTYSMEVTSPFLGALPQEGVRAGNQGNGAKAREQGLGLRGKKMAWLLRSWLCRPCPRLSSASTSNLILRGCLPQYTILRYLGHTSFPTKMMAPIILISQLVKFLCVIRE